MSRRPSPTPMRCGSFRISAIRSSPPSPSWTAFRRWRLAFCSPCLGRSGPILGQNYGARLYGRLRQILSDSFVFAATYVVFVALALSQAAPLIIHVFAARGQTAELLNFFCVTCGGLWFFLGGIFVANASFNNLGFPILSTLFNWGRATAGTMPFVAIGAAHFGPRGGFLGLIAGAALFRVLAVLMAYFVTARLASQSKGG
jgi:Na+-driven multidrug efflux pump